MSIAKHFQVVSSFVQSESCKISCPDTENVQYLFSGEHRDGKYIIQGEPVRSCGCKAQRVFNRLQPTKSQMSQFEKKCMTWDFYVVAVSLLGRGQPIRCFNVHTVCYSCWNAFELESINEGRLIYQKNLMGHERYEDCLDRDHDNGPEFQIFPGETHPYYAWEQLWRRMERDGPIDINSLNINGNRCYQCNDELQNCVYEKDCLPCAEEGRVQNHHWRNFSWNRSPVPPVDLIADEVLDVTLEEEDLRPTTPEPTFEVFVDENNEHVYVPREIVENFADVNLDDAFDMSDDDAFDMQQYLFEHGYH